MGFFEWLDNMQKRRYVNQLLNAAVKELQRSNDLCINIDSSNSGLVSAWKRRVDKDEAKVKELETKLLDLCKE